MSGSETKVAELIEPIIADMGFDLVRVRLMQGGGGHPQTLQVMAERPDGSMNVDSCAAISRAISAVLDVEDPIRGEYFLEVSSPGIDRPLVRPRDFEKHAGFIAKVDTTEKIDGRRRFRGVLKGMDGDDVLLEGDEGSFRIAFNTIDKAKLVLTDELIAAHQAQQQNSLSDPDSDGVELDGDSDIDETE